MVICHQGYLRTSTTWSFYKLGFKLILNKKGYGEVTRLMRREITPNGQHVYDQAMKLLPLFSGDMADY